MACCHCGRTHRDGLSGARCDLDRLGPDQFRRFYRDRLCVPAEAVDKLLDTLAADVGGATRDGDR